MKQHLARILSGVLIFGVTACSSPSGTIDQPVKSSAGQSTSAGTRAAEVTSQPAATAAQTTPVTIAQTAPTSEASLEKQILVDEKDIKITATGLSEEGWMGPGLKVLIENNSGKDLTVQTRATSVNGYMVDGMMSADVAAGKKANDEVTFMTSEFEAAGIRDIADIELSFHVFTTEGWNEYLDTDLIQIKTSLAADHEYTFDDSGEVLYEKNDVRIIARGISADDSIFGPGLILYIENLGKKSITVQAQDVSVNGFMIDHSLSSEVSAGKRTVDALTFFQSDLEENDIDKITDAELAFHIFDTAKWDTLADTEKFTLNFD